MIYYYYDRYWECPNRSLRLCFLHSFWFSTKHSVTLRLVKLGTSPRDSQAASPSLFAGSRSSLGGGWSEAAFLSKCRSHRPREPISFSRLGGLSFLSGELAWDRTTSGGGWWKPKRPLYLPPTPVSPLCCDWTIEISLSWNRDYISAVVTLGYWYWWDLIFSTRSGFSLNCRAK